MSAPIDEAELEGFKVPSLILSRPPRNKSEGAVSQSEKQENVSSEVQKDVPSQAEAAPPPLPYNEPTWSTTPPEPHSLTVIKSGTIIQEIPITKPFLVFGRLPSCDVQLEHPSVSRHHAVLQYRRFDEPAGDDTNDTSSSSSSNSTLNSSVSVNPREEGFYAYDLGSTHGTYINKTRIQMRCYHRLRLGQMVKFGGSSRLFLLESSCADPELVEAAAEDEIKTIVRHKENMEQRKAELLARQQLAEKEREDMVADDIPMVGADGEDIDIDEEKEALYKEDPKKALKKFFDREGLELEYETEEEGQPRARVFTVRVRLPIETASGESVYAEASHNGKKKDAVVMCALNACRMLDAQDMLRHHAKGHKARKRDWADNDYYDSDEDTFLDRTGLIEKKRKNRMKKAGAIKDVGETYESLEAKVMEIQPEIATIEKRLADDAQADETKGDVDSLEAFMSKVGGRLDRSKRLELTHQLHSLRNEKQKLLKLMNLAKSTKLPELKSPVLTHQAKNSQSDSEGNGDSPQITSTGDSPQITITKHSSPGDDTLTTHEAQRDEEEQPPDMDKHTQLSSKAPRRKRARRIGPTLPPPQEKEASPDMRDDKGSVDEDSANYANWLPPEKQTGDGKTFLNEKFGY